MRSKYNMVKTGRVKYSWSKWEDERLSGLRWLEPAPSLTGVERRTSGPHRRSIYFVCSLSRMSKTRKGFEFSWTRALCSRLFWPNLWRHKWAKLASEISAQWSRSSLIYLVELAVESGSYLLLHSFLLCAREVILPSRGQRTVKLLRLFRILIRFFHPLFNTMRPFFSPSQLSFSSWADSVMLVSRWRALVMCWRLFNANILHFFSFVLNAHVTVISMKFWS